MGFFAGQQKAKGLDLIEAGKSNYTAEIQSLPKNCIKFSTLLLAIDGPKDSPYEGGIFKLEIDIPEKVTKKAFNVQVREHLSQTTCYYLIAPGIHLNPPKHALYHYPRLSSQY